MNGDFRSLVWVNDKQGHEYVCIASDRADNKKDLDALSDNERASCINTNDFIGTDRW
jgi:hypothetical protein